MVFDLRWERKNWSDLVVLAVGAVNAAIQRRKRLGMSLVD
jgi:hypothetical protein